MQVAVTLMEEYVRGSVISETAAGLICNFLMASLAYTGREDDDVDEMPDVKKLLILRRFLFQCSEYIMSFRV